MKKRILPALLALVMVLTMLPLAVFADTGSSLSVDAYGFVWNGGTTERGETQAPDVPNIEADEYTGDDWMGETVYLKVSGADDAVKSLYTTIKVTHKESATAESAMYAGYTGAKSVQAFSFLNTNQWDGGAVDFTAGGTVALSIYTSGKTEDEWTTFFTSGDGKDGQYDPSSDQDVALLDTVTITVPEPGADKDAMFTYPEMPDVEEECTCETKCTAGNVDENCPVCKDLTDNFDACEGAESQEPAPAASLTIQAVENQELSIFGKTPADMGAFEIKQNGTTVTVTGAANYIDDYTGFNGAVAAEQKGHYLPIQLKAAEGTQIVVTNLSDGGKNGKTHTFASDGSIEMSLWLDGDKADFTGTKAADLANNTVTVTMGEDDAAVVYTVNFAGVTLVKAPADNQTEVTVTPPENEGDTATVTTSKDSVGTSVDVDADLTINGKDLSDLSLKIDAVDDSEVASLDLKGKNNSALPTELETLVKAATVVDVKIVDENDQEVAATAADLGQKTIKISITVDEAGTYYVFTISSTGVVTSYGYKTVTDADKTITFETTHLTMVGASLMEDDDVDTIKQQVYENTGVEAGNGVEGGEAVVDPSSHEITFAFEAGSGVTGDASGDIDGSYTTSVTPGTAATYDLTQVSTTGLTAPTGMEFYQWTLKTPVTGVSISADGETLNFSAEFTGDETTITLVATWQAKALTDGDVVYTPYNKELGNENYEAWLSGHLTLKNLVSNNYYLIQVSAKDSTVRTYQIVRANGTQIDMIAQSGAHLQVLLIGANTDNLATKIDNAADWTYECDLASAPTT